MRLVDLFICVCLAFFGAAAMASPLTRLMGTIERQRQAMLEALGALSHDGPDIDLAQSTSIGGGTPTVSLVRSTGSDGEQDCNEDPAR